MKNKKLVIFILLLFGSFTTVRAQYVLGHYGPGLFGMRSAHGFPLGWSYVNVTQFYYAGEMKDNEGKISTVAKPVNVIANVSAGIWGIRLEKLKANYNAALVVPVTNLAPNPETLELDPEKIGFGDMMLIPLMLSWSFDWIAVNTRYGIWLPVGSFEQGANNNLGKGFWSHNVGLGVTIYFDKSRTWSISSMNTLEINSRQKTTRIKPASNWISEWSIGKTFDKAFNLGLIGYLNYQVGKQQGGDLPDGLKNYRVNGMGMELGYRTANKWFFLTRWYMDFLAINRLEGTAIRFVLMKNF